jgi:hypothetical protein
MPVAASIGYYSNKNCDNNASTTPYRLAAHDILGSSTCGPEEAGLTDGRLVDVARHQWHKCGGWTAAMASERSWRVVFSGVSHWSGGQWVQQAAQDDGDRSRCTIDTEVRDGSQEEPCARRGR